MGDILTLVVIVSLAVISAIIFAISYIKVGLYIYMKVVKELYIIILETLDYKNQPVFSKPFYVIGALLLCVILALPVCAFVVKCLEQELKYWEQ